jgi:tellurite resistance protein
MFVSAGLASFALAMAYLIGLACGFRANAPENLTKEEFAHCVQIVLSDIDMVKEDGQKLIDELLNYTMNIKQNFEHLSQDAKDVIGKVKGNKMVI